MYKSLADSTLHSMTKKEIIELLRMAERNAKVLQEHVEQQAENFKDWVPVVRCKDCKHCGFCGEATNLAVMGYYGYCSRGER